MVEADQESTSPYGYVYDHPIKFVDPDGRVPEKGPGPKAIIVTGLVLAGGTVAVAAPTVVGEAIAVPVAVVEVTGAFLIAGGVGLYGIISNALHKSESTEPSQSPETTTPDKVKSPPNPHGAKGKPDHQEQVKEEAQKAEAQLQPGERVVTEQRLQGHDSKRKPDVQVLDKNGKARKVTEVERKPNSKRNKTREAEYDNLGLEHQTIPVRKQ